MKTTNIISTPDITGNIGSCETKTVKEKISSGVILDEYQVIMTNSCSGQIIRDYQYVDYGMVLPVIFLGLFIIVMGVMLAPNRNDNNCC